MFSDTFAGIAPSSVLPFLATEALGAVIGYLVVRVLYPDAEEWASEVVIPQDPARR